MEVKTIHSGSEHKKFAWHVAQVFLDKPRLGLTSIVVLSLHLNNAHAKKPVAGPNAPAAAPAAPESGGTAPAAAPAAPETRGGRDGAAASGGAAPKSGSLGSAAEQPSRSAAILTG